MKDFNSFQKNRNSTLKILPFWFRLFLTLQILLICFILIILASGNFSPVMKITVYGIQSIGINNPLSFLLLGFIIIHLIVGIFIMMGKHNVLKFARLNYIFALVVCSISVILHFIFPENITFKFPFEIAIISALIFSVKKIEYRWKHISASN